MFQEHYSESGSPIMEMPEGADSGFEKFVIKNSGYIFIAVMGLVSLGVGVLLYKGDLSFGGSRVEIIEPGIKDSESPVQENVVVEVSGAVENPGVYKMAKNSRVNDILVASGGLSALADRVWVERNINRAGKLTDGQKIYIPKVGETSQYVLGNTNSAKNAENIGGSDTLTGLININTANQKTLEKLPGIGPVYAQNIIEGRIYSNTEELLSRGILKSSVFDKIKDKVTVN